MVERCLFDERLSPSTGGRQTSKHISTIKVRQTVSSKVYSREGNSPDHMLRILNSRARFKKIFFTGVHSLGLEAAIK